MDAPAAPRRAAIIGTGLIGGSIGLALRHEGWHVTGIDADPDSSERAIARGAIDTVGSDADAEITFVAVPAGAVPAAVREALRSTRGVVTDVASVKSSIVAEVGDPRFVGGHPMAGSEQLGVDGASVDLFQGAVWVLTPSEATDGDAFALVRRVVRSLGADVVALPADRHDALVATVSHVPHLTAAALMGIAGERAEEHAAVLRLAAGGFRDMTRIASGTPTIWPDICRSNRTAIVEGIDRLTAELGRLRAIVDGGHDTDLLAILERAQLARRNLPGRVAHPEELVEVRLPVPDRQGVIAEVTALAAELGANLADVEVAHSSEGDRGVLILLVDAAVADPFALALAERGYRPTTASLS